VGLGPLLIQIKGTACRPEGRCLFSDPVSLGRDHIVLFALGLLDLVEVDLINTDLFLLWHFFRSDLGLYFSDVVMDETVKI